MHKNTFRNTITGIIGGIILSTSVANGQVDNNRIKVLEKDKNNTTFVPSTYQSVDAFNIVDPSRNTFIQFTAKNPNPSEFVTKNPSPNNINYVVITYDEYKKKVLEHIAKEKNSWVGYYKPKPTTEENILNYVEQTPFRKFSNIEVLNKLDSLVAKYLNNKDKIISCDGNAQYTKGVLTPKESSDIISKLNADICNNMVIPVLATIPAYKNIPADEVPTLLLFAGYAKHKPITNNQTPKKTPEKTSAKQEKKYETTTLDSLIKEVQKINDLLKNVPQGKQGDINSTTKNNNYYGDTNKTQKNITPTVKKDTIPQVEKNKLRFIIGGGAEDNAQLKEVVGHGTLGVAYSWFSIMASYGCKKDILDQKTNDFPSYGIHPVTGQRVRIGGTTETINATYKLIQPELKIGFDVAKNVKLCVGTQYNYVKGQTSGILIADVMDDNWNLRSIERIILPQKIKFDYWTVGPSIGIKSNSKKWLDVEVDFGVYVPVKSKIYEGYPLTHGTNLPVNGNKPSYNLTMLLNIGNAHGYNSKPKIDKK